MRTVRARGTGRRAAFLVALREGRSVADAAAAAGVNRTLLYKWRTAVAGFADAWDEAVLDSFDRVEEEALRRAMQGVERPVFYRGEQVGSVTTYSDRLLIALLQRRRAMPPPRPAPVRRKRVSEGSCDAPAAGRDDA